MSARSRGESLLYVLYLLAVLYLLGILAAAVVVGVYRSIDGIDVAVGTRSGYGGYPFHVEGIEGGLWGGFSGFFLGAFIDIATVAAFINAVNYVSRRLRQNRQVPARLDPIMRYGPRSLRWVGVLLPGEEGRTWLAEVASYLAEAADPGERRRYVRSYRRAAPWLVWVSWTEYLSGSRRRELL